MGVRAHTGIPFFVNPRAQMSDRHAYNYVCMCCSHFRSAATPPPPGPGEVFTSLVRHGWVTCSSAVSVRYGPLGLLAGRWRPNSVRYGPLGLLALLGPGGRDLFSFTRVVRVRRKNAN